MIDRIFKGKIRIKVKHFSQAKINPTKTIKSIFRTILFKSLLGK